MEEDTYLNTTLVSQESEGFESFFAKGIEAKSPNPVLIFDSHILLVMAETLL